MNVKTPNGFTVRAAGYEGESLLKAFYRSRIFIPSDCEGGEKMYNLIERPVEPQAGMPLCRQCHVIIDQGWIDKIYKHHFEERALTSNYNMFIRQPNSRLACAVRLEKWMNEMCLSVGPSESEELNHKPKWWENPVVYPKQMDQ